MPLWIHFLPVKPGEPRFQAPPQAFLPGGLITAGIPRTRLVCFGVRFVNGCDDMGLVEGLAKQSFGCKENGCIKGGCENPF